LINAYQKRSVASIDTVLSAIAENIRQGGSAGDLAKFQQNVKDGVHESFLYEPLVSAHLVILSMTYAMKIYSKTYFARLREQW
jgi:hypothetical protein